jgi:jumonji domain-containing protein 7
MKFDEFADWLENEAAGTAKPKDVLYIQNQNSNFTEEYHPLWRDVAELDFARQAFNAPPDAVNIWVCAVTLCLTIKVGSSHSVSSLHKDNYENIYAVLQGSKTFLLFPPTDIAWLQETYKQVRSARWNIQDGEYSLDVEEETLDWIAVDPRNAGSCLFSFAHVPDLSKYPQFEHATPIEVAINPGEILYLPVRSFARFIAKTFSRCGSIKYHRAMPQLQ